MSANSQASVLDLVTRLIDGVQNAYPTTQKFTVAGQTMTQSQLVTALGEIKQRHADVNTAKSAYEAALEARDHAEPADSVFLVDAQNGIKALQTSANQTALAAVGVKVPKARAALTTEQRMVKVARARATRAARGTMGKRQKAAITTDGTPSVVVVSPTGQAMPGGGQSPVAPAPQSTSTSASPAPAPGPTTAPTQK